MVLLGYIQLWWMHVEALDCSYSEISSYDIGEPPYFSSYISVGKAVIMLEGFDSIARIILSIFHSSC